MCIGDLNVLKFGHTNNDMGEIIYEMNEFDEGTVGSYQHDVWRMATSLALVAQEMHAPLHSPKWISAFAYAYKDTVDSFTGKNTYKSLRTHFIAKTTNGVLRTLLRQAEVHTRVHQLDEWSTVIEKKSSEPIFDRT